MRGAYSMAATLLAFYWSVAAATTIGGDDEDADVNVWLAGLLNVRIVGNDTALVQVPGYMYDLYGNNVNQRYDVIRNIWPTAESIGSRTRLMYDVSELEPNETVQKAVLQLDSPRPRNRFSKAIEASFYSSAKWTGEKSYLGSTRIRNILELDAILGSKSVTDLGQLIVYIENTANPPMGLVLYSTTPEDDRHQRSHELATLMFKTEVKRHKRSVIDNEIDDVTPKNSGEEQKQKKKKNKKKKVKGMKLNKLQAVDAGDSIVFTRRKQCRLAKLTLNFADIGWQDWVIHPKGFETNYCTGGCVFPLDRDTRPTNHATVQSLARTYGRFSEIPEPSCVPETLAPVTLLYMDRSNHVILKSYPDMSVLTCACN